MPLLEDVDLRVTLYDMLDELRQTGRNPPLLRKVENALAKLDLVEDAMRGAPPVRFRHLALAVAVSLGVGVLIGWRFL